MKKCMLTLVLLTATTLVAEPKKDAYDIRPDAAKVAAPSAVEWQNTNDVALAEATTDDALAAIVADETSALGLLNRLKGAYATEPLVAFQVAAVSQWVMGEDPSRFAFWKPSRSEGRRVWVKALIATAEWNSDNYIKTFCLDQLRWCGCNCPCLQDRILKVGETSGDKGVKDFAVWVVRELQGR